MAAIKGIGRVKGTKGKVKAKAKTKCMNRGCNKAARARGNCPGCYHAFRRAIASGKIPSWQYLIDRGLALPEHGNSPVANTIGELQRRDELLKAKQIRSDPKHAHSPTSRKE